MSDNTKAAAAAAKQSSVFKNIIFSLILFAMLFALFEVLASVGLMYNYRFKLTDSAEVLDEVSPYSSVNLAYKVLKGAGLQTGNVFPAAYQRYKKETVPEPFFIADEALGYTAGPGVYSHKFFMRQGPEAEWRALDTKITMNEDGSRWTGPAREDAKSTAYVFGDSVIFGTGVHDEHTFSYLLQQARPDLQTKLFALGGYSLTQSYLRFESMKDSITADDIIILGYADFYDTRNVMSPSRLRARRKWTTRMDRKSQDRNYLLPKVSSVADNEIEISYVQENCSLNNGYCETDDPSGAELATVTAGLINYISDNTEARVYVLHFNGSVDNPALAALKNVTLVSVLPEDFDSFVKDDIEGFDPHPGPYWHHAVSTKLQEVL
jgi:hypothetical protein